MEGKKIEEGRWWWEGGSYQEMFSPGLSHLATEATSYYDYVLAMTMIIIKRRQELKNPRFHLADELRKSLLVKGKKPKKT